MSRRILREEGAAASGRVHEWSMVSIRPTLAAAESPADLEGAVLSAPDPETLLYEARSRAEALLRDARRRAEELVSTAHAESAGIRQAAEEQGRAAGNELAAAAWAEREAKLDELLLDLDGAYVRFCEAQLPRLTEVALRASERILHEQVTLEPERVQAIVSAALQHVTSAGKITVHLNPEDIELVRSRRDREDTRANGVVLAPDAAVRRGGCWIESEQGEVDATIDGAGARLRLALESV